jgi:hypothetical protein
MFVVALQSRGHVVRRYPDNRVAAGIVLLRPPEDVRRNGSLFYFGAAGNRAFHQVPKQALTAPCTPEGHTLENSLQRGENGLGILMTHAAVAFSGIDVLRAA